MFGGAKDNLHHGHAGSYCAKSPRRWQIKTASAEEENLQESDEQGP